MDKKDKKDSPDIDGILDTEKDKAITKSIEPESLAQARHNHTAAPAFGIFLDVMDRIEKLKHAKSLDVTN